MTYTYNADGVRTGKTVVTRTYEENHTHSYVAETFAPTCINRGYTIYTCACGDSYTGNYVSALGHNFVNSKCTRCNMTQNPGIITPITPITPIPGIGTSEVSEEVVTQSTTTRVLKSTRTENYKYVYNGGSLSQMVITTTVNNGTPTVYTFNFQYDANGTPMSMVINGSEKLYYVTNLQGDVTALLNESGNEVAEYTYSAYGEINSHLYITSTNALIGAMFNPLKYRGYVHDIETDWYYLQSRYYDPEVGRFLNADIYTSTGQSFEGNNMFAYCLNNPIVFADKTGSFPWLIIAGAVIGAASEMICTWISGGSADEIIISGVFGFAEGAFTGSSPKMLYVVLAKNLVLQFVDCSYANCSIEETLIALALTTVATFSFKSGDEVVDLFVDASFGSAKNMLCAVGVMLNTDDDHFGSYAREVDTPIFKQIFQVSFNNGGGCSAAMVICMALYSLGRDRAFRI